MRLSRTARRVLLACVVSNTAFACIGIALTTELPMASLASGDAVLPLPTDAAKSQQTSTSLTTVPPATDTSSAPPQPSPSSRASLSTRTPSTSPAAAANDVTGIASSAAPPTSSRIAPDAGSYPATFTGSASVDGRSQAFQPTGAVVFAAAGSNLRQSAPGTPGDVVLLQRFSAAKSALVSFQLKAGDNTKVFKPSSPVTYLTFNVPQGTTWGWSATSTDGATTVQANALVVGQQTMNLDGEAVSVLQITTNLTISGDITGTAELTAWVSPTYRLPLMQRQVINARSSSGYGFTTRLVSDVTQALTSLRPSQ